MTRPDIIDSSPDQQPVQVTVNNGDSSPATVPTQPNMSSSFFEFGTREVPLTEKEKWFKTLWRPAAAWTYLGICIFDFVIAPCLTMILPKLEGIVYSQWQPLTTVNGGLFHLAFGAILGVTAWGRTKERVSGLGPVDNG